MPRTDNQKAVTAYLSLELYDQVKDFKIDEGLKSDSQAIAAILERFFNPCLALSVSKPNEHSNVEGRLEKLEKKIALMEFNWRDQRNNMLETIDFLLYQVRLLTPQAIEATVEDNVPSTVESTVESDVLNNVPSTVESTVESDVLNNVLSTVDSDVLSTVESDVLSTVESDVLSTVESTVDSDVLNNVPSTVESTVDSNVPSTVESTVKSDVLSNVPSTVESTVESDVLSNVPSTVGGTVDDNQRFVVCAYHPENPKEPLYWHGRKKGFKAYLETANSYIHESKARREGIAIESGDMGDVLQNGWKVSYKSLGELRQMQAKKAAAIALG